MIDGNISMEEDTELRDLVVQTLENNGVLAKVRAELRASVFLALEEQESVMNPEPLLNKTVKQYLANSEGKLLFSLVREFLEYFGLEYTISVYDPETYFGKEYHYVGRNKLCEELGIDSTEPLLGEILKNSINSAFINTQKFENGKCEYNKTDSPSPNFANTTFEVPVSKVLHVDAVPLLDDTDFSQNIKNVSQEYSDSPLNPTIMQEKNQELSMSDGIMVESESDGHENSLREHEPISEYASKEDGIDDKGNNNIHFDKHPTNPTTREIETGISDQTINLNQTEPLIKIEEPILAEVQTNQNESMSKQNSINSLELQIANNVQNKKPVNTSSSFARTVYFEKIIVDGKKENVNTIHKADPFLQDLPPIDRKPNSIFGDLPPLNGKKSNIGDIKELMNMELANDGTDNYEEDFVSSASGSANEQSPSKDPEKSDSPTKLDIKKEEKDRSTRSEDMSDEIEEIDEILSSTSCVSKLSID
ncbi:hypothetical protein KM043_003285 [Ampulex compressa]|nr:hypothetical protein KM043_003285 [Ampulex compressa]